MARSKIHPHAVGAYGEKVVEAQLLRRGWLPSNVNASIKNAADFDILAQKDGRVVCLRVKTCGPGQRAFQFHLPIGPKKPAVFHKPTDFTILVSMGNTRDGDEFWILPTHKVQEQLWDSKIKYLGQRRRDGGERLDTGQWTLSLDPLKRSSDGSRPDRDIYKVWREYHENWEFLNVPTDDVTKS